MKGTLVISSQVAFHLWRGENPRFLLGNLADFILLGDVMRRDDSHASDRDNSESSIDYAASQRSGR